MRFVGSLSVAAALLCTPVFAQLGGAGLSIAVSDLEVTVSGASAGGSVVVFGVAKRSGDYVQVVERRGEILVDSDADGIVSLDVAEGVPEHGVWFAYDETSKAWVIWPSDSLSGVPDTGGGEGGELPEVEWTEYLETMILRPGGGAWSGAVGDGGPADLDGLANGAIQVDPASLDALAGSLIPDAPATPSAGDLVITVDPDGLVVRVESWN
ncbi:MAG: hypothetical protein AMXMBFR36_26650 [Acidobacteriota bacterium]